MCCCHYQDAVSPLLNTLYPLFQWNRGTCAAICSTRLSWFSFTSRKSSARRLVLSWSLGEGRREDREVGRLALKSRLALHNFDVPAVCVLKSSFNMTFSALINRLTRASSSEWQCWALRIKIPDWKSWLLNPTRLSFLWCFQQLIKLRGRFFCRKF